MGSVLLRISSGMNLVFLEHLVSRQVGSWNDNSIGKLGARFECSASPIAATLSAREIDKRSAEYAAEQFGGGTRLQIEADLRRGASVE